MQDNETRETIDSVDYLIKAAALLPSNTYAHKLLKSHLLTKSRKLLESCTNSEQCTIFNDEEVCRKCTTPWSDTNYSMNIQPVKMKKCRAAKILRSQAKQQQMVKRMSRDANNVMITQCSLCRNRKRIVLWKKSSKDISQLPPKQPSKPKERSLTFHDLVSNEYDVDSQMKKRKHKKDKTAGLLYTMNKDDKQVKKVVEAPKPNTLSGTTKSSKNKSKTGAGGGPKAKVKLVKVVASNHIQKKPSILQLAGALKKKSVTGTSAEEKLRKMLN